VTGERVAAGGDIDRNRPLRFRFDGRQYGGFAGDSLASALLANGVGVVGRSFKLHRPRGLLAAGVEEPNAIVTVGRGPGAGVNLRATEVELFDGLDARAVNCWPSARFDVAAINGLASRFLAAGFYYKTFMWPHWRLFEPAIRRAAGLGRPTREPDPVRHDELNAHCEVLVVGAGVAGLAAARAAARTGVRIILAEQSPRVGGALRWRDARIEGTPGKAWADQVAEDLANMPDVRVLTRTTAVGYFDHNTLALVQRPSPGESQSGLRLWRVRAAQVVLATGALERPLVFPGNDRPGVMLASAVRRYLFEFGVRAGHRLVVFTRHDDAYDLVEPWLAAGGEVAMLVDARVNGPADRIARLRDLGIEVRLGASVTCTRGTPILSAVDVQSCDGGSQRIRADVLAMSGGWNPALDLFRQSGGKAIWDPRIEAFRPLMSVQAERSCGAAAGTLDLSTAVADGEAAGSEAASGAPQRSPCAPAVDSERRPAWQVDAPGKAFVDFQNDVTAADIALATRENFVSVEHLKRYTTLGMAVDQGKTSGVNGLAILGELTGREIAQVGTTSARFPYTPVDLGAFAGLARGELFRPRRHMPAHGWHVARGAVFEEYGGWTRPSSYPREGETTLAAEQREALAVRQAAGLFDGSPLGKIEVVGPDAPRFLDLIYANVMSNLKVGRARYGLMLNDHGVILDDGVTARLAEDRFLVGTTGAGASRIAEWLEEWLQCEWPQLRVLTAPVTTAWGVATLSGPKARQILRAVGSDIDLAAESFPHMAFREGRVADIPARVFRVSYTGDLSFEINVPADRTEELWNRLMAVGAPSGLEPVGLDAWMLLRTEKGYLHLGGDTDGTTNALDVGWGHILKRKTDFIGRRSLIRREDQRGDRFQFVGLEPDDLTRPLPVGAHLRTPGEVMNGPTEGYVTSSGFSPHLARAVSLGMVRGGRSRLGERVQVVTEQGLRYAKIASPGVFDPSGARLNA
jgi:sarcosine oxidase subunit alpha